MTTDAVALTSCQKFHLGLFTSKQVPQGLFIFFFLLPKETGDSLQLLSSLALLLTSSLTSFFLQIWVGSGV